MLDNNAERSGPGATTSGLPSEDITILVSGLVLVVQHLGEGLVLDILLDVVESSQ